MIKKTQPTYMLSERDQPENKRPTQTKSKGMEKIFQANGHEKKKAGVAILISDKIAFRKRAIKRAPEGHFIIHKGVVQQKDITLALNIYAPNTGAPKYIKKILEDFEKHINSNTIIVGDFNTALSTKYI